jgi:hypothetical protein
MKTGLNQALMRVFLFKNSYLNKYTRTKKPPGGAAGQHGNKQ